MLSDPTILLFVIIVNLIAAGMTWLAWRRPDWGRFLFGGMFLLAGFFNLFYALNDPEEYVYYAEFAFWEMYRDFIIGTFAEHAQLYLTLIAIAQVFVGVALWGRGRLFEVAALMGVVFLIAIVPLGFGAAFPAPVIMAIGSYLLYTYHADQTLWMRWMGRAV